MERRYIGLIIFLLIPAILIGLTESSIIPYNGPVVGIHLGTIYSSAAVYRSFINCHGPVYRNRSNYHGPLIRFVDHRIEFIKNERGSFTTPTWSIFGDTSNPLIEDGAAKYLATLGSEGIVVDLNRLIGKKFDDPEIQNNLMSSPYYDVVNVDNKAYIQLKTDDGETKVFNPEVMVAMILWKMKTLAETHLGEGIKLAVVVVPSYFTPEQIEHIRSAGKLVGLGMCRGRKHSDTSPLAYGFYSKFYSDFSGKTCGRKMMIYNLGGYSCDVTIKSTDDELDDDPMCYGWHILSTGCLHLGGESFNHRMMNYFIQLIKAKYGKDISSDREALRKLNCKCEEAKRSLSSQESVKVELKSLFHQAGEDDESFEILTRDKFEQLNIDLFNQTIDLSKRLLQEAGLEIKDIDYILLAGGSTQIPKIQSMVKDLFQGKDAVKSEDFDLYHVFPYGAADEAWSFSYEYILDSYGLVIPEIEDKASLSSNFISFLNKLMGKLFK